ncbi:MAG TPA: lipopolysaccharide biosynthesis protein, partial [Candidatus Sumerlaeota bacterium]|nr:lipopolysaccharide biosynthesis protein [Candidatus Sumerlaeota bacterium]
MPDRIFTRIIKNTVFLYISTFIGQIAALILLPIIIGKVGKADYGLYVLALSVPPLLSFLDFGMSTAVV